MLLSFRVFLILVIGNIYRKQPSELSHLPY